jgi:5-formyltetrahydrofolate cyclo-ligase
MRTAVRSRVAVLSSEYRSAAAAQCVVTLAARPEWAQAGSVLLFAPLNDEMDIWPLIELALTAGKKVALPSFASATNSYVAREVVDATRDIVVGHFGVREPRVELQKVSLNQLDFALVSGLAFDTRGGRLGRGKGFYDRLLADVRGTKCGLAFDEQIVDAVPVAPHDIRLNCILTPTRWIET